MSDIDRYLYQFHVIVVGESMVGKSCVVRRFKENSFEEMWVSTVGVEFCNKTIVVDGHKLKLQLWDTAGQERFRAIARAYYRNAAGVLLIFSIENHKSFAKLKRWLDDVLEHADRTPIFVLVGNKSDMERDRQVLRSEAEKFANTHGMDYIETSAKTNTNIDEAFTLQATRIYEAIQDGRLQIDDGWGGVKKGEEIPSELRNVSLQVRQTSISKVRKSRRCCS